MSVIEVLLPVNRKGSEQLHRLAAQLHVHSSAIGLTMQDYIGRKATDACIVMGNDLDMISTHGVRAFRSPAQRFMTGVVDTVTRVCRIVYVLMSRRWDV